MPIVNKENVLSTWRFFLATEENTELLASAVVFDKDFEPVVKAYHQTSVRMCKALRERGIQPTDGVQFLKAFPDKQEFLFWVGGMIAWKYPQHLLDYVAKTDKALVPVLTAQLDSMTKLRDYLAKRFK